MLKRIFWLGIVVLSGWTIWQWFRQRQSEFSDHAPQFAPAPAYTPARPAAIPAEVPAPSAPAADLAPADMLREEPAPPPAAAGAVDERTIDALFADDPAPEAPAADEAATEAPEIVGYCMRCHAKRPIKDSHEEISESGRRAARGTCPVCGTNMFTFLAANDDERGATSETRS